MRRLLSEIGTDNIEEEAVTFTLYLPAPGLPGPSLLQVRLLDGNILVSMEIMAERYEEVGVTVVFMEWCFYLCRFYMVVMKTLVHADQMETS